MKSKYQQGIFFKYISYLVFTGLNLNSILGWLALFMTVNFKGVYFRFKKAILFRGNSEEISRVRLWRSKLGCTYLVDLPGRIPDSPGDEQRLAERKLGIRSESKRGPRKFLSPSTREQDSLGLRKNQQFSRASSTSCQKIIARNCVSNPSNWRKMFLTNYQN